MPPHDPQGIISDMPTILRANKMSLRLTDDELQARDRLAEHLGINPADVMRQGLLRFFRDEGLVLETKKEAEPKPSRRRL